MLVHLIHELVITKIEDDTTEPSKRTIEAFVESIRQQDPVVIWTYEEEILKRPSEGGWQSSQVLNVCENDVMTE